MSWLLTGSEVAHVKSLRGGRAAGPPPRSRSRLSATSQTARTSAVTYDERPAASARRDRRERYVLRGMKRAPVAREATRLLGVCTRAALSADRVRIHQPQCCQAGSILGNDSFN